MTCEYAQPDEKTDRPLCALAEQLHGFKFRPPPEYCERCDRTESSRTMAYAGRLKQRREAARAGAVVTSADGRVDYRGCSPCKEKMLAQMQTEIEE